MPDPVQPQVVRSYLSELQAALIGVPTEVSDEIVAGIAEELSGLDAATAATRIEGLGDPMFIAAEARTEAGVPAAAGQGAGASGVGAAAGGAAAGGTVIGGAAGTQTAADPRWYTVVASLFVALGGVVIPVLGWIVGIAMVWLSKSWRTWEKWVATVLPFTVVLVAWLGGALVDLLSQGGSPESGGLYEPQFGNVSPMSSLFLIVLINVIVGIWLLWRALRR
ncbi:hypothetical protein [Homoserinimonas sp. OAct 916]|uniref:HAAS signaling domain-containing protein n=1 Tax=Homoserinimonas sp. OAct 916 TaxID=2211450 RepID=UPI000DBE7682|nr:hypothetical protein [Homoserinimonas sp. OAct 916]